MRHRSPRSNAVLAELCAEPAPSHLRTRWRLARQDRRSAALARRYGALGMLMAAERLSDVANAACPPVAHPGTSTARAALDVLWRTLHMRSLRTAHWNPGVRHLRQAGDLRRWAETASPADAAALLRCARRLAADDLDVARGAGRGSREPLTAAARQ